MFGFLLPRRQCYDTAVTYLSFRSEQDFSSACLLAGQAFVYFGGNNGSVMTRFKRRPSHSLGR